MLYVIFIVNVYVYRIYIGSSKGLGNSTTRALILLVSLAQMSGTLLSLTISPSITLNYSFSSVFCILFYIIPYPYNGWEPLGRLVADPNLLALGAAMPP